MAEDISRRIDDLLAGAIDEQVREQRALNDIVVSVRDGVSRLVGDVAALSARVSESRETSQGLREELPFLVQREVTGATNALSVRIDVLETAIGELVASLAGLEDRVGPDVIINGITERLETMRAANDEVAGSVTAEAARTAIDEATEQIRAGYDDTVSQVTAMLEKHHATISRRLADASKEMDEFENRMRSLEKGLDAVVKMPGDVKGRLAELTGSVQDLTDGALDEIRSTGEASSARIAATVEGLERDAETMSKGFGGMTDQLARFQEELLAYLQVRDVALEERRDQIVTELLGDFLDTLPQRERERSVGLLRTVFQRRRDRRDADRYRGGRPAAPLPRSAPIPTPPVSSSPASPPPPVSRPPRREPEPPRAQPVVVEPPPVEPEPALADALFEEAAPPEITPAKMPPPPKPRKAAKAAPGKAPKQKKKVSEPAPPEEKEAGTEIFFEPLVDEPPEPEPEPIELSGLALAPPEPEPEKPARKAPAKKKAAPRPRKATKVASPEPEAETQAAQPAPAELEEPKPPAPSAPSAAPAPPAAELLPEEPPEDDDDTLSQALARVQQLVEAHRQPRGGRKRPR